MWYNIYKGIDKCLQKRGIRFPFLFPILKGDKYMKQEFKEKVDKVLDKILKVATPLIALIKLIKENNANG